MDVNVDVGPKLAEAMQQLAAQIGTTADKVFPWYVQQQLQEGVVGCAVFIMLLGAMLLSGKLFLRASTARDKKYETDVYEVLGNGIFVFAVLVATAGATMAPTTITQITNPQYHAVKAITNDVGNMIRRK